MRRRILVATFAVPLLSALVVTLFAWPAARLEPRGLAVGLVGGSGGGVEQRLATRADEFDLHRYADADAARTAIRNREIYGAFAAVPGGGALVLTAPAASPTVAQLIEQTAAAGEQAVRTEEVVPAPQADRRGTGLAASVLPLAIAGVLTGAMSALMAPPSLRRAALVTAGALLGALAATAIVHGWLGIVEGYWPDTWAVLGLTIFAVGSVVAGLEALLGRPGVAVGGAVMIVIGNATSAAGSAAEMLPPPMGAIGQLLPPGASVGLLRSTSFFDGAAAGRQAAVLGTWALLGLAALFVAALRGRRRPSSRTDGIAVTRAADTAI